MKLSGEEKKLQALFSQLKAVDEHVTPHFGATWNRAQIAPRKIRMFNPAFVAAMMLLVFSVAGFAVWSRYSRTTSVPPAVANVSVKTVTPTKEMAIPTAGTSQVTKPEVVVAGLHKNAAARRQAMLAAANRKLQKDAKSIASWTSPTSALLDSPSDEIFSSLPEFNQSTTQLKSFLPSRSN